MWCHLTALAGLFVPFGNVIGPLIIWQMKRQEFPSVDEHGKEAMNFQLSVLLYLLGGGALSFLLILSCIGAILIPVVVLTLAVIHLGALILSVIAGIKANDGVAYKYPMNLRLVK